MSIKRINNLLKSIKDSYKSLEDGIYKVSEVVKPPKGPKLSLYNIYIFEFLIMFYSLLIGLLHIKVKEKYIFVNVRFGDLIHSLDKKDVLVCGGKKDFLYCLKHRIKFKWIGFLIKAFDIYYYYGRDKSYVEALNLLNKLFSDDKEKQFIFLWDDMQKLGTSFAHVFRQRDSIEVVCIQHGIYVFNDSNISPGSNSNYNFVFVKINENLENINE